MNSKKVLVLGARHFERVMDNSKVFAATGMKQKDLMPLYDGLSREIGRCPCTYNCPKFLCMDEYLSQKGLK